jgi:sigma-B regulation protein RsbU (phosphoserine phosphatase)
MQNGETDSLHMDCPSSEDRQCWLSYQPVAGTDWSIAVLIPMDELAGSQLEYRYFSLVITIIGLILLTLIVVMLSRRLTRPLLALTESTRALARGELDRPIDDFQLDDEIGALARQYQLMQASLKNYIEQLNLQTARRERLEGELSAAHDIQMQMLPDQGRSNTLMPGWQLSAVLEPAKSVGGDFYHYQLLDEKRLFIAIGDVSDKGVAAALFMAKTQTLLRQLCCTDDDLGLLLSRINQQLCIDNSSCMFVTLLVGVLDIESGALDLASAGHPPPLVGNPQCGFIDMETGPALGFFADASFTSHHSTLARHSPLVLTTDGVDEASNSQLQHYGEQRLQNIIRSMHGSDSKELLQKILADIVDFRASAEPSDDLTIMILMRR